MTGLPDVAMVVAMALLTSSVWWMAVGGGFLLFVP